VDALLFPREQQMGWRAVFCDHAGDFIICYSKGMAGAPALELVEAIATRNALSPASIQIAFP
jgi:hypothetical protein